MHQHKFLVLDINLSYSDKGGMKLLRHHVNSFDACETHDQAHNGAYGLNAWDPLASKQWCLHQVLNIFI